MPAFQRNRPSGFGPEAHVQTAQLDFELLETSQGHWCICGPTSCSEWHRFSNYSSLYPNAATADHKHYSNRPSVQFPALFQFGLAAAPMVHLEAFQYADDYLQAQTCLPCTISLETNVSEFFLAISHTIDVSNPLSECSQKALSCKHAASSVSSRMSNSESQFHFDEDYPVLTSEHAWTSCISCPCAWETILSKNTKR